MSRGLVSLWGGGGGAGGCPETTGRHSAAQPVTNDQCDVFHLRDGDASNLPRPLQVPSVATAASNLTGHHCLILVEITVATFPPG